jgi:RHS repeat-associated protein
MSIRRRSFEGGRAVRCGTSWGYQRACRGRQVSEGAVNVALRSCPRQFYQRPFKLPASPLRFCGYPRATAGCCTAPFWCDVSINPFRYTARESDTETGLYYYRARYYDSAAGRFLKEDPMGFNAGVNFYSYVLNRAFEFQGPRWNGHRRHRRRSN